MNLRSPRNQGFTLIELLAVIGILALVAATALPGLAGTRGRNKTIACLNNLRQMGAASQMYAQDDSRGRLTGTLQSAPSSMQADDDLNWLHGFGPNFPKGYIDDLTAFCCPATRNTVRATPQYQAIYNGVLITKLLDLDNNAVSNTDAYGHSYEMLSCWYDSPTFTRKTASTVLAYRNKVQPDPGGPSQIFILMDAMEPHTAQGWRYENFPNPYNGHGQIGGNVAFADGHAAWIAVERWHDAISRSQDFPASWSFPPGY
jgi:prepilin-type N-terminal cleavage/methylation domain-containing protein/prepilin-type processing-associated H-X9-DG protein